MKLPNVEHLLAFRKKGGEILSPALIKQKYKFEPDGTNQYYAIDHTNALGLQQAGSALNLTQRAPFDDLLSALIDGGASEKTIVLGLEPDVVVKNKKKDYLYDTVAGHTQLLEKLADEIAEIQGEATDAGKKLNVVMRYASEMNDTKLNHAAMVGGYKSTFAHVRAIFKQRAPNAQFSFSPALRADLTVPPILDFWPGNDLVDIVAGSWYIGAETQRADSIQHMKTYFIDRKAAGKPFGLSEIGGCNASNKGNDAVLKTMFAELAGMEHQGGTFRYVTIFLEDKWGADATLSFVPPG